MVVRMNVLAQENIYHVGVLLARDTNPHAAMCVHTTLYRDTLPRVS